MKRFSGNGSIEEIGDQLLCGKVNPKDKEEYLAGLASRISDPEELWDLRDALCLVGVFLEDEEEDSDLL